MSRGLSVLDLFKRLDQLVEMDVKSETLTYLSSVSSLSSE